jgi:radical SAM superfamily enzyme YgiQ (UPF0313 family)
MKIQLLQTKLDEKYMKNGRDMMVFPLGLAAIATYVKQHNPDANIELIDGDFEPNLEQRLDGDIIGIQPNILNVDEDFLVKLHENKQTVILGGVHTSHTWEAFTRLPFVDYAAIGDGEIPMLEASKGIKLDKISGLASARKKGTLQRIPIDNVPIIDRSLYDQSRYMENSSRFIETYAPSRPFRRMTNIYTNKGCNWRARTGGCYFCGRLYGELKMRSPKNVWTEVTSLVEHYGADFLWDTSDSFTSNKDWLKEMVDAKPAKINPYWYIYSRISELSDEVLAILKRINVYQMLVGIETGDNKMAKTINKGNTRERTLEIAYKARQFGIKLLPSFVVGLPGESNETLEATYQLAKQVVEANEAEELSVSMLIPLPGSKAYTDIKAKYQSGYHRELPLLIDGEVLQREWFKYMCNTDFDTAIEYMYKLLDLTPLKSTFGSPYLAVDYRIPGWNQLNSKARHNLFYHDH